MKKKVQTNLKTQCNQLLHEAFSQHGAAQLEEAAEKYCQLLSLEPDNKDALHLYGVLLAQRNDYIQALFFLCRALIIDPQQKAFHDNLMRTIANSGAGKPAPVSGAIKPEQLICLAASVISGSGDTDRGLDILQRAAQRWPDNSEILQSTVNLLFLRSERAAAIIPCRRLLELNPDNVELSCGLGFLLFETGENKAAFAHFQSLSLRFPEHPRIWLGLALSMTKTDGLDCRDRLQILKKALDLNSHAPELFRLYFQENILALKAGKKPLSEELEKDLGDELWFLHIQDWADFLALGFDFAEAGFYEAAWQLGERIMREAPDDEGVFLNLGTLFWRMGYLQKASECFTRVLSINPEQAAALNNAAALLRERGFFQDAVLLLKEALRIQPDFAEAFYNMGLVAEEQNNYSVALEFFNQCLKYDPEHWSALVLKRKVLASLCYFADVKKADESLDEKLFSGLHKKGGELAENPFSLGTRKDDPQLVFQVACLISERLSFPALYLSDPAASVKKGNQEKLRLGFLSCDFREHAQGFILADILPCLSDFAVFLYSWGDPAEGEVKSLCRQKLLSGGAFFRDITNLSDPEAAGLIKKDAIDILVDLKGWTQGGRPGIAARRPAIRQAHWLGQPGTSGSAHFDWIIADRTIIPEAQRGFYTEKPLYLSHSYFAMRPSSLPTFSRSEAGLPEGVPVMAAFHHSWKITSATMDLWLSVMQAVPESVLWVMQSNSVACTNIRELAIKMGVSPERIIFAEKCNRKEHLKRLQLADFALDAQPCNGIITTADALLAAVPVLTICGSHFPARASASILNSAGLSQCVFSEVRDLSAFARLLASDKEVLQGLKTNLQKSQAPFFNVESFAAEFSGVLIKNYTDFC